MAPDRHDHGDPVHGGEIGAEDVVRRAVAEGLLTEQDANDTLAALRERAAVTAPEAEPSMVDLVDAGILEGDTLARLAREIALERLRDDAGADQPSPSDDPFTPGAVHDPFDRPPVSDWDRYEIIEFLGRGGMGDVYKARDPRLGRFVALKFLRRDDPQIVQRFMREAQVQARIDHENVCPVYEVGEVRGIPFLAMQYVAGGSIKEIGHLLDIRDKARIMVDVADGLHAAHQAGLVHRDVKPANILVDRDEEGWRPFLVDFGIARDLDSQDLTVSGMVLGTPAFAAPEQVRGDNRSLDARTDVYSLGATLYWFLTDHTPREGGYGELIRGSGDREPVPPHRHDRDIPVDLETIVLKCLETEPDRRYASAREVSEDLRRFLAGEPVTARRPSVGYRVTKRIRRHPGLTAATVLALLAFLVLGLASVRSNLRSRRQAAIAQRFVDEVKQIEASSRLSSMMPLHDWRDERDGLRRQIQDLELRLESMDDLARGPAHSALGRGWLALGELERARNHLEAAGRFGYTAPAVTSSMGLVLGRLYERGLAEARQIEDPRLREARIDALQQSLREPALDSLRSASAAGARPATAPYVEGLIAYYEDRFDEALSHARQAAEQTPWMYESWRLEGDVHVESATRAVLRGDHDAAIHELEEAGVCYERAADIARSDPGVREAECERLTRYLELTTRRGWDPQSLFTDAERACRAAVTIEPDRASAWVSSAILYWRWADRLSDMGEDPVAHLESAVESAARAIQLDPAMAPAHHTLGGIYTLAAAQELAVGRDPTGALQRAVASLERAVELKPRSVTALDDLGYAWERRARWEMGTGSDPRPSLDHAAAAYRRALEIEPGYPNPSNNLGIALWRRAVYTHRTGGDPVPDLEAAISAFQDAIRQNPSYAYAFANLGLAHRTAALVRLHEGRDPLGQVSAARDALDRALFLNPSIYWALPERASAELVAARWAMRRGDDAGDALDAAAAAATRATEVNPRNATAWQTVAEVHRWRAERLLLHGGPVDSEIDAGSAAVDRALSLNPTHASAHVTRAALYALAAQDSPTGDRRRQLADRARSALEEALRLNPLLARDCSDLSERIETIDG